MRNKLILIIILILILIPVYRVSALLHDYNQIMINNKMLRIERLIDNGYTPCNQDKKELDINEDGKITNEDYEILKEKLK